MFQPRSYINPPRYTTCAITRSSLGRYAALGDIYCRCYSRKKDLCACFRIGRIFGMYEAWGMLPHEDRRTSLSQSKSGTALPYVWRVLPKLTLPLTLALRYLDMLSY
ncbi:hypothetical protein J6590_088851 [Homalodisca vitripennis]|nr:hypothetical protein J6590_088851 [Homalodisca vitripennis]